MVPSQSRRRIPGPWLSLLAAACWLIGAVPAAVRSAELHVMSSGGFTAAFLDLAPLFEKQTGHTISLARGASMGNAPDAIPNRLARGEPADVVILAGGAVDGLVEKGFVVPGSRTDLALSRIGVTVRADSPMPDIGSVAAVRAMLLAAPSMAYSASASGVYVSTEMLQRLGIADQVLPKSRRILSERVATVIARGEAAVGFQQISEILGVPGAVLVGPLPEELQQVTPFSAGLGTRSREPDAAKALIRFLVSPEVQPIVRRTGLDAVAPR